MESTTFQPNRQMLYMHGDVGFSSDFEDEDFDFLYGQVVVRPYDTFTSDVDDNQYPVEAKKYAGTGIGSNPPVPPWARYEESSSNVCHAAVWDKEDGVWYVVDADATETVRLYRCAEMLDTDVDVIATDFFDNTTHVVKDLLLCTVEADPSGLRKVLVFRIAPRDYAGATSGEPYGTTLSWMPVEGGSLTDFDTIQWPRLISGSNVQRQILWSMDVNRTPAASLSIYGLIDCFFYTSGSQTHFQQRVATWRWDQATQTFNTAQKTGAGGHFIGPLQVQTDSVTLPLTLYTRIGYCPSLPYLQGSIAFVRQRFVSAVTVDSTQSGVRRTQHEIVYPLAAFNTSLVVHIRLPLGPHEVVNEEFNEVFPVNYGAQVWQDDEMRNIYLSMEGSPSSGGETPKEGVGIFAYPVQQESDEPTATASRKQLCGRQALAVNNDPMSVPLKLVLGPGCY